MTLYHAVVTLHLLAALVWLGGMFFLALVGAPVLRRVEPPELRASLFRRLGVAFRRVGWVAIAVLLATGAWNLGLRGMLRAEVLFDPGFWSGGFGRALASKLILVAAMLVLAGLHDFVLGPRASREADPEARARARRWASWLARVNGLLGVVLVYVAVRLARGG